MARNMGLFYIPLFGLALGASHAEFTGIFKMTYSTADPVADRDWVMKFFDAEEVQQPHPGGDGECALVKWVEFPDSGGYEWHFVDTFEKNPGPLNYTTFNALVSHMHGDLSAPDFQWDAFMDFHTTVYTPDLDILVARLQAAGEPFIARGDYGVDEWGSASVFLQLPSGSGIVEVVSPKLTLVTPEPWDLCASRARAGLHEALRTPPAAGHKKDKDGTALYTPIFTTYASSDPAAAAEFLLKYGGGVLEYPQTLPGGDGECADIRWLSLPGTAFQTGAGIDYQLHFVHDTNYRGSRSLVAFENYLETFRGNISFIDNDHYDPYMDNHIGIKYGNADELVQKLLDDNVPFFTRCNSGPQCFVNASSHGTEPAASVGQQTDVFMEVPGGVIYELLADSCSVLGSVVLWDLCGPNYA